MSRLVFITGASSGIGQALALRFFQAGWRLALAARRTDEVKAWAEANMVGANSYQIYSADVSSIDSIVAAGHSCMAHQGVPDVVIASAGISVGMDTAMREDLDVMAQTFATNNTGLAATFQPFIAALIQRGSRTFSSSPTRVICGSLDFEHSVLASRLNSCVRKSNLRPTGSLAANRSRAAARWAVRRFSSSSTSMRVASSAAS